MKNLLSILCILWLLISCDKEKAVPVKPVVTPAIKKFFNGLPTIQYRENAKIDIVQKIFSYKNMTNVDINWGDGIAEKRVFYSDYTFPNVDFLHIYSKNGTYKVSFKATSATIVDSVSIDVSITNKAPIPVADFSYEIFDKGRVKFKNLSFDSLSYYTWSGGNNRSYMREPEFIFEANDTYTVYLSVRDKFGQFVSTSKNITITNAILGEKAMLKGTVFNRTYNLDGDNYGFLGEVDSPYTILINSISKYDSEQKFNLDVAGMFRVLNSASNNFSLKEKYEILKQNLTVGIKKVGVHSPDQWNASIRLQTDDYFALKSFNDDPNSSIEITEVREIDQPVLFDQVYPKAFWVTFKLKADFKEVGKVDAVLKIRYLVVRRL